MLPDISDIELWERVKRTVTPLSKAVRASLHRTWFMPVQPRRLDLHGYTVQEAYKHTLSEIQASARRGEKQLLIITGKGVGGKGVLKRELPLWLDGTDLPISSVQQAPAKQGGEGAYIVKLKRRTK